MNRETDTRAQAGRLIAAEHEKSGLPPHLLVLMFAGILLAYLLLLTRNYYWDGIFFAQTIENSRGLDASLLHPNHLIYNVFGYLFYRAALAIGLEVRGVVVLQVLNCFIGTLSAYLLFRILLVSLKSLYLSIVLTVLFAFSATWWKFSTDADSYIPSVLLLLITFYLILPDRKPKPFLVAVTHALAICFHQLAVLFFPVVLLGVLFQTLSESTRRRALAMAKYALTGFLITFPLFYYSFYLVTGSYSFKPFLQWVTTFSPEHGFTFNAWDNLTYTLRGHLRLFVGGRFNFLRDLASPFMYVMAGVVLLISGFFYYKLFRHFKEVKSAFRYGFKKKGLYKSLRLLCVVWIVCYLIFLFFFIPQNTFYRLFYLPAIIVLLGTFFAPYEFARDRFRRYRAALFVALVAALNLTFSAYPYAQIRANPPLALALELNKAWPPGTVIFFASWNSDNSMVRYFNPSTVWREANRDGLEKEAEGLAKSGTPMWLDTTMIDLQQATPDGQRWLETHTVQPPQYQLVNSKYRLQFYEIKPERRQ